ncbi:uncharacterized protein LOC119600043 [Lucilia sericata]|uniref:uncharacterized protein LOC119600043 n=1 Tax=Lucilia sericata TaxID=13632 RepID=UPI0018A86786|nr:uncharacterized protein LOC119600043 [Lucilia sericata]
MTNSKTRKTSKSCKDAVHDDNITADINSDEVDDTVHEIENGHWMESTDNECLAGYLNDDKYRNHDEDSEDADEIINDGDTSTSFSLQECMNEFRARRIRRTSLSQHRQDPEKSGSKSSKHQEATELDLINQNLCNKEQERKCKPCQNGFCYCFTSDSGDGGGNLGDSHTTRGTQSRNPRRNRRSECSQFSSTDKRNAWTQKSKERIKDCSPHLQKNQENITDSSCLKSTKPERNQLTAISSLETGARDAPLIHIIQELRNNCVISKVRVNKHKIQPIKSQNNLSSNGKNIHTATQKAAHFKDQKKQNKSDINHQRSFYRSASEKHIPTAPTLEKLSELGSTLNADEIQSTPVETIKKCTQCSERRRSAGGQLLQKRLSNSQFTYKARNIKQAPPKPPRSSFILDDKYFRSSDSTSPSVREAERVVDDFLKRKGLSTTVGDPNKNVTKTIKSPKKKNTNNVERVKRKSYPLNPKDTEIQTENILSTYPSLSDMKRVVESKKSTLCDKNIRPVEKNAEKVISIGWNEAKISDMLNYDANMKKGFHSTATQAQPQQRPGSDVIGNENTIGWQIPPRINLDTVDGIGRHNLASNLEDKNTPVKTKLIDSSKKNKDASRTQKFIWSEQLRQLSPWTNKQNMNDTNDSKLNLRSSSKAFIKSSKKKFLRLVSPKKENRDRSSDKIRKTPYRNVGVQTSCDDVSRRQLNIGSTYEHSSSIQSPPGSYHSPIQSSHIQSPSSTTQSQNTTPNGTDQPLSHFDFSRTVHSPPKKAPRSSQRKLNFPINAKDEAFPNEKKTYRSFNSELDNDVSISKISYILSNIRSKLEACDEHAVRTFMETDCTADRRLSGFDFPDGHHSKQIGQRFEKREHMQAPRAHEEHFNDPIYSEIEDDSVHISESPNFDNHTGIQHFTAADNPEILYAKVNKSTKHVFDLNKIQLKEKKPQIPLAKIMQDSLKSKKITSNITPLPPLPEPSAEESVSYSSPTSVGMPLSHCQSLNNVRVMEHNSPPKKQRNFSKSDLSLHRSEIFLDNLCRSELVVDTIDGVKIQNDNRSYVPMAQPTPNDVVSRSSENDHVLDHNDTVSYELPNDDVDGVTESIDEDNSTTAGSNLGLSTIIPPSSHNQSTPKKQSFTTKDKSITSELNVDVEPINTSDQLYNSCPNTPHKQNDVLRGDQRLPVHSHSMNEVSEYEAVEHSNAKTTNALARYKNLKNVLQKSFRKSKTFIKTEGKRLSTSLNFSTHNATTSPTLGRGKNTYTDSNLNIETLFSLNECASVSEQIAQTVSICRKLPDLEISTEMVEAERLLLFSALRREIQLSTSSLVTGSQTMNQKPKMRFFIDEMFLPVLSDVNHDIFFNYFYIVTFECGGVIKSTQSAECVNGTAVFRDCGIEFMLSSELETNTQNERSYKQNAVKCNIFMLRLRKISTISIEPRKRTIIDTLTQSPSSTLTSRSSSSSCSNEVVSRFRLHASFNIDASDFVPYEYVHQESNNSDRICIRASGICTIALTPRTKSTNLSGQVRLKGRAEVRFPKRVFAGFLNVEDPHSQHNWNRRWCTLDGLFLYVWQDENTLNMSPILALDLRYTNRNTNYPLTCSPRELCARPRSFCLECTIHKTCDDICTATVFFAAETQENLDDWLKNLNIVLDFIITWL